MVPLISDNNVMNNCFNSSIKYSENCKINSPNVTSNNSHIKYSKDCEINSSTNTNINFSNNCKLINCVNVTLEYCVNVTLRDKKNETITRQTGNMSSRNSLTISPGLSINTSSFSDGNTRRTHRRYSATEPPRQIRSMTSNPTNCSIGVNHTIMSIRGEQECSICKEKFKIGEIKTTLECIHHYHKECIKTWSRERRTCPECNNPF